jgi:type II secretory pathway component PulF
MQILTNLIHNLQLMGFRAKRTEFYEQIARSIESKETLRDFLIEELRISRNKRTKDASRAFAFAIMLRRVEGGSHTKYSQILAGVVPDSDRMMLSALDDANDKPALFRAIALSIDQQSQLMSVVRSKMLPPLMIMPGVQSLPIVTKIAPEEVWNPFNSAVRGFCEFVASYAAMLVPLLLVAGVIYAWRLPRWIGEARSWIEQISPGIATALFFVAPWILPTVIYRDVMAGRLFTALAVMLKSGRTLNDSLITIRSASSPWMRWHLSRIIRHLEVSPTEYARAFSKGLVSPGLLARLSSQIRTTPRFEEVLIGLGTKGSEEVRVVVARQMSSVNLILLGSSGFLIVFLIVGQLSISNSLSDAMSPTALAARQARQQAAERPGQ